MQLLKSRAVNSQRSQHTPAAPLPAADVSRSGAKSSVPAATLRRAGLACTGLQDQTGQHLVAPTPPLLASEASRSSGDGGPMLDIGTSDLLPWQPRSPEREGRGGEWNQSADSERIIVALESVYSVPQ